MGVKMMLNDHDRNQVLDILKNIYDNVSNVKNLELRIILADGSQEKLFVKWGFIFNNPSF